MTLTHGILVAHGMFDRMLHEMEIISENDSRLVNKKVNWKETRITDHSNHSPYWINTRKRLR